jgi:hypothetical protein
MMKILTLKNIAWILGILIFLIIMRGPILYMTTSKTVEAKIKKTENVAGVYRIYTDQGEWRNTDVWWLGKWNSSSVYNDLTENKILKVKVYGLRFPPLSWYPNVVEVIEDITPKIQNKKVEENNKKLKSIIREVIREELDKSGFPVKENAE